MPSQGLETKLNSLCQAALVSTHDIAEPTYETSNLPTRLLTHYYKKNNHMQDFQLTYNTATTIEKDGRKLDFKPIVKTSSLHTRL